MGLLFLLKRSFANSHRRRRPACLGDARHRAQRAVDFADQIVDRAHGWGTKFIQPVIMYLCWLGETTPACVCVKSEGQMSVRPFFASNVCFWYTNWVPPPSVTSLRYVIQTSMRVVLA